MRLSEFVPRGHIVEMVEHYAKHGETTDFAGVESGKMHAVAYAAQLKVERDRAVAERDALQQELHDKVTSVLRIRCIHHVNVPQVNANEYSGGECGACIAAERDSLARRVEALERMVERSAV